MPLYEYKCEKCGHRFELIERVTAAETRKCLKCKGKAVRLPSSPAIQFKGSGWYVTDYAGKNSSAPPSEGGDSKPAASSDAASAKKESSSKDSKESSGKSKGRKEKD